MKPATADIYKTDNVEKNDIFHNDGDDDDDDDDDNDDDDDDEE